MAARGSAEGQRGRSCWSAHAGRKRISIKTIRSPSQINYLPAESWIRSFVELSCLASTATVCPRSLRLDSCSAVRSLESVVDIIQSWFARSKSMERSVTVSLTVRNNIHVFFWQVSSVFIRCRRSISSYCSTSYDDLINPATAR